uniref:Uncharacterized protein n=1 Tax=Arundo donax TaxID=35708 RepID=A0A0A9A123_ARUDO
MNAPSLLHGFAEGRSRTSRHIFNDLVQLGRHLRRHMI